MTIIRITIIIIIITIKTIVMHSFIFNPWIVYWKMNIKSRFLLFSINWRTPSPYSSFLFPSSAQLLCHLNQYTWFTTHMNVKRVKKCTKIVILAESFWCYLFFSFFFYLILFDCNNLNHEFINLMFAFSLLRFTFSLFYENLHRSELPEIALKKVTFYIYLQFPV